MRYWVFAGRNLKELVRDPWSLLLSIGTPAALIALIAFIMSRTDGIVEIFSMELFAPGMVVFSCSFLAMFLGTLMVGDSSSSYMIRLFSTPMRSRDFIIGYGLPIIPLSIVQLLVCLLTAALFGLQFTVHSLLGILVLMPTALLNIGVGLLLGSVFSNVGLVSGFGAVWIAASISLSGTLVPAELIGGGFYKLCRALPFIHSNEALSKILAGDSGVWQHIAVVLAYAVAIILLATIAFKRRMKS